MPVVDGRLTCCVCGSDLGDAEDQFMDPNCQSCEERRSREEMEIEREVEDESLAWASEGEETVSRGRW